jgi:hypothetical protein
MESDSPSFLYKPLKHRKVRLFHLAPESDSAIRGAIVEMPFSSMGTYQAVSYAWGNQELSHSIHTMDGVVKVSESLHYILSSLTPDKEPLLLWVDAICVNQSDLKRKGATNPSPSPHIPGRIARSCLYKDSWHSVQWCSRDANADTRERD